MIAQIRKRIEDFVVEELGNGSLFLVEVYVSNNAKKVEVILDGDNGISIDQCAGLSRKLGAFLEEEDLMSKSFQLHVSSPGVDRPIKSWRQYASRIGRSFKFEMENGSIVKGKLKGIDGDELLIDAEFKEKGKKKINIVEQKLSRDQIAEAKVLVSFK